MSHIETNWRDRNTQKSSESKKNIFANFGSSFRT